MSAIIAGIGVGAAALGKGIYGITQNNKASAIERDNKRPVEAVDPIYQQNVNTAQNMAQVGLAQQDYNNQLNNINQNQAGAISALNGSANPGANLASIVRAGDSATGSLNAQDAAARNKNTLALIQQRGILAGANKNAWNYNYADKYSENLANSQALRGAGARNTSGAFNDIGQAGMNYLGGMSGTPKADGTISPRGQEIGGGGFAGIEGGINPYKKPRYTDSNMSGIYNNMA